MCTTLLHREGNGIDNFRKGRAKPANPFGARLWRKRIGLRSLAGQGQLPKNMREFAHP
jgi:hypothetical protein